MSTIQSDYVLVFNTRLTSKSASAASECERQYTQLLDRLAETGLDATGRPGGKGTGELLIFVKCPEKKLKAEVERERINDWMHGVCSTRPDPRTRRDFSADPISPNERLRLTYRLITGPQHPSQRAETPCAGIVPQRAPFDRVKSIFAPHDLEFNKKWISRWTSFSHVRGIPREELNSIKDHLGESIAYYFEFLRYYFIALAFPSFIGFVTWSAKSEFNSLYASLLVLWSIIFIEAWTVREKRLAVRWGTYKCSDAGSPRTDFKPDQKNEDGAPEYTWWKREGRIVAAVPALLGFAGGLACLITAIYTTEVMINEVYDGPGKRYLSLLPTILFAGIVPQVVAIWQGLAFRLTRWENHSHTSSFNKSLTLKMFAMNALTSFGGLTLTAFVYIPFGNLIVPHLHSFVGSKVGKEHISASGSSNPTFNVNSQRLHNTLFALTTTTQVIGAFTEIGVPLITRYVFKSVAKVQERRGTSSDGPLDEPEEREYLERIRHEASLPEYNLFVDYAEMAVQFGYVVLWSVIWPLAPLMAFINNFFELRSDAFKMTVNVRRPTPTRTETLGPWLHTLGFITWVAALTNSGLVYLYRPHPEHNCDPAAPNALIGVARQAMNATANALNSTMLAPEKAILSPREAAYATSNIHLASSHEGTYSALRATMFSALLVALASEHGYLVARTAVRHVIERLLWRGTEEEVALRRGEERLKVGYMEGMGLEIPKLPKTNTANAQLRREVERTPGNASDSFWARADAGVAEIKRLVKQD